MIQRQRQFQILPDRHGEDLRGSAVYGDAQRDGLARQGGGYRALLLDPQRDGKRFSDDAEGGGGLDHQPPVPVRRMAGQQHVQRCGHVRSDVEVMHLPVADKDRPRDPRARFLGQGLRQRGHGKRPGILGPIADDDLAQFGVGQGRHLRLHPPDGHVGLRGAVGDILAGALIDDQQDDVGQRPPFFGLQRGLGQRRDHAGRRQRPKPPALQPAPGGKAHQRGGQRRHGPEDRPGQKRVEDDLADHCPSLSRSAGTWT